MEITDLKKENKAYKANKDEAMVIYVSKMKFIRIDGCGNPNTCMEYNKKIQALYKVFYTLKFAYRTEEKSFTGMPLE